MLTYRRRKTRLIDDLPDPEAREFYRLLQRTCQTSLPVVIPTLGYEYNQVKAACTEFVKLHQEVDFFIVNKNQRSFVAIKLKPSDRPN